MNSLITTQKMETNIMCFGAMCVYFKSNMIYFLKLYTFLNSR